MDNKTVAESQFCDDINIEYLAVQLKWKRTYGELKELVISFLNNYKGYVSNFRDPWETTRYLNRLFLQNVNTNPSTETTYSSIGETIFHNEEVYY